MPRRLVLKMAEFFQVVLLATGAVTARQDMGRSSESDASEPRERESRGGYSYYWFCGWAIYVRREKLYSASSIIRRLCRPALKGGGKRPSGRARHGGAPPAMMLAVTGPP